MIDNKGDNAYKRRVYICQNKDEAIRFDSTSGGVFSALALFVINRGGVVFGAEFDPEYRVIHGYGTTIEDLSRFRGSKYVQSHLGDTFKEVNDLLMKDRWVLFSGTPCQIEGLATFLGKNYEKLILMDIVCFSISSPKVWRQFIEHLENTGIIHMNQVARIKFRDKTKFGYEYTLMTFYDKNGKVLYSSGPESNQMLRSFVSNTSTRPSCYECRFKKTKRISDFTAWDCYNVYKYNKEFDDNKGTSNLMVHTEKGVKILKELEQYLELCEVDLNNAVNSEPAMNECAQPNVKRDRFFKKVRSNLNAFDFYFQDTLRVKVERVLRKVLSNIGLYAFIKRVVKR